jgi:hypothetical protein
MREEAGRAELHGIESAAAGQRVSFSLVYHAGKFGIDDSGALKIVMRYATDMAPPQFHDPQAPNYLAVHTSNSIGLSCSYDRKNHTRPWGKTITAVLSRGNLQEGQRMYFHFQNFRMQTFCEESFELKVLVDIFATRQFVELLRSPAIRIVPGEALQHRALLPGLKSRGEPFSLHLTREDLWGNPTAQGERELLLTASLPVENLPERIAFEEGRFVHSLGGLAVRQEGILRITLSDAETGAVLAESNPLCIAGQVSCGRYWGDLHGQSEETIGTNTVEDYFRFARDRAFLDVSCHQGNDFQIDEALWQRIQEATRAFHRDGSFVVFPGYEWSGNTGMGGDHNVIYRREGEPIIHSSHALITHEAGSTPAAYTSKELFRALSGRECFLYAHVGGRYANIKAMESRPENLAVEIHSSWGTFEWLLHDAFEAGLTPGIVANSDGHKGRPGASYPGAAIFGSYGGLTCFLAEELSRDGIFKALAARHHYATTGARIYLDVSAELTEGRWALMGDRVEWDGEELVLSIKIAGTAPILRVELYNGRELWRRWRAVDQAGTGERVRIQWQGAEYRGRGRETVWDGRARLIGNAVEELRTVNFWNPEKRAELHSEREAVWESQTTGGFSGVDLLLRDSAAGALEVETPLVQLRCAVEEIGDEELVYAVGGLDRRLELFRLPPSGGQRELELQMRAVLRPAVCNPIYVKVVQEDGHMAWSSPIYVLGQQSTASGHR